MCRLRNIHVAMRDYQESVTTGQTHRRTHGQTDNSIRLSNIEAIQYIAVNIIYVVSSRRSKEL